MVLKECHTVKNKFISFQDIFERHRSCQIKEIPVSKVSYRALKGRKHFHLSSHINIFKLQ